MDLTHAQTIEITLRKRAGAWHWTSVVDGRHCGSGVSPNPDHAVDSAEATMWPAREAEEHGKKGSPEDEESAELPEENTPHAPGAVPTAKQVWESEAKQRAEQKSALEKL